MTTLLFRSQMDPIAGSTSVFPLEFTDSQKLQIRDYLYKKEAGQSILFEGYVGSLVAEDSEGVWHKLCDLRKLDYLNDRPNAKVLLADLVTWLRNV